MKANYFYTQQEGLDWEAIYAANAPAFDTEPDVGHKVFQIMEPLKNEHFFISGGGSMLGNQEPNYPMPSVTESYGAVPTRVVGNGSNGYIRYTLTKNNVVYVSINSFPSAATAGVTQNDVNAIFDAFPNAAGMIIDVRYNGGGQDDIANMFGRSIIDRTVRYANYDMDYNGTIDPVEVVDDGARAYYKPLVCLSGPRTFSQAELFVRFMEKAGATIVGAATYGAEGRGQTFQVGDISFRIPVQGVYDVDMNEIKLKPVIPDVQIAPSASYDATHDYVLEAAEAVILR